MIKSNQEVVMEVRKKLGFGLMRLPRTDGKIDIEQCKILADTFLANGYTYFDTAYAYQGSEEAFKEFVVKRHPRESYTIASKMAGWMLREDFGPEEMFKTSLERTGAGYFDYYLLHSLQPSRVGFYDQYGCWEFCRKMKEERKIRNLGFSYHGDPELLEKLLQEHPYVDFVQLQINYTDWDSDVIWSGENYRICDKYGKDIVVMEPIKGGFLANIRPEYAKIYSDIDPENTPASMALRFVGSLPRVKVILSGMNALEQMTENTRIFNDFKPLSEEEKAAIAEVTEKILSVPNIPCTACRYCTKGCPMGINIPEIFKAYNMYLTFGDHNRPHLYYRGLLDTDKTNKASACIGCGQCEGACPQHIQIIEKLKDCAAYLDR